ARFCELFQQNVVNVAFSCLLGNEIPQMAYLGLADSVNAAEPLLDAVGVPWQVVVHHQVRTLPIYALTSGVGSNQHLYLGIMLEGFFFLFAFRPAQAAMNDDHSLFSA